MTAASTPSPVDNAHTHDHDHHGHSHSHHHHDDDPLHLHHDHATGIDAKIIAVLVGGTLLIASVVAHLGLNMEMQSSYLAMLAALLLGTPIVWSAAMGLLGRDPHASSHMEELVALAILGSFATGQYIECGAVAFFMLLSDFIEHRTAAGARKSIEALIRLKPTKATILTDSGEQDVDASTLQTGQVVVIRPGEIVPGDGTIRDGSSTLNEANITGESLPVEKAMGDDIYAGTINETGRLEVEITRAGRDSTLGKVQALILQAASTRPQVVRELEKYASYYTPVVLMLGAVIYFFNNNNLEMVITLLLIACPCAIILAAPTAVVAAVSAAARVGVLIKSVNDLEVVRRLNAIVFDKTGTLTTGNLSVTRIKPVEGVDPAEFLGLAAAVEKESKHPVARAVAAVARKAEIPLAGVSDFEEVQGRGVKAMVEGQQIIVGREAWLSEQGVHFPEMDRTQAEGMSLLFVARNGQCIGWIGLTDEPRADARESVQNLADEGVKRRVMITGDRWDPARRVAKAVGVTDIHAEALPGDKLQLVEDLKNGGYTVGVIGDGVNDGPALAAGHVSIAMGAAGSDVAINAASIALMNNRLDRLPFLIHLSRRTTTVIRQNLIGVGLYILLMLALLAYITPIIAAIGHGVSSILVIFSSARLIREGENLPDAIADHLAEQKREVTLEHVPSEAKPATT